MPLIQRVSNFKSGEVIKAADFNNEFDNLVNTVNDLTDINLKNQSIRNAKFPDDAFAAEKLKGVTGTDDIDINKIPSGTKAFMDISQVANNTTHAATTKTKSYLIAANVNFKDTDTDTAQIQLPQGIPPTVNDCFIYPDAANDVWNTVFFAINFPHGVTIKKAKIEGSIVGNGSYSLYFRAGHISDRSINRPLQDVILTITYTPGNPEKEADLNYVVDNTLWALNVSCSVKKNGGNAIDARFHRIIFEYETTNLGQT